MSSPFGELISAGEGDYNSYNRGTTKDKDGRDQIVPANQVIDFSQMTIGELRRRQGLPLSHPDRVFAVGKYQFIPDTLNEGLGYLRIERDKKFTPELQDQLFVEYSLPKKRPEISAYIQGTPGATLQAAQKATSKEWASVEDPDTPGHVYWKYEKSGNKMHTTAAQVAIALNEMRAEYKAQIDKGLSAEEAWRATASMGPGSFEHGANAHKVSRRFEPDATTRQLQETLNALGYTDTHGHVLAADGHNGSHTREAVESFQRDHGLHVDGIAGPVTLAAVKEATARIPSIGQPDALYLREGQTADPLADYRAFTPPSITSFPQASPAVAPSAIEPPATFPAISHGLDTVTIHTLQCNLNTVGITDPRGHALPVTGDYDTKTRMAVMGFQAEQHLPITGQPDAATLALIQAHATIAELQQFGAERTIPLRETPSLAPTPQPVPQETTPTVFHNQVITLPDPGYTPDDPRHPSNPDHALYNELHRRIPEASEKRLAQFTAACHTNGITVDNLSTIHLNEASMTIAFLGSSPLSSPALIDLSVPPPQQQQSVEHIQQYDQQQAQMIAQIQVQNAQINTQAQQEPMLGGR